MVANVWHVKKIYNYKKYEDKAMVNVYELLGIPMQASEAEISLALAQQRQQGQLNPEVLDKAEAWLLNPAIRARYDAQLRASNPAWAGAAGLSAASSGRLSEPNVLQSKPSGLQHTPNPTVSDASASLASNMPTQETCYEALVGAKSDYYLNEFANIEAGKRGSFNMMALLGGGYWYATRGMWGLGIMAMLAPLLAIVCGMVLMLVLKQFAWWLVGVAWLLWRVVWLPSQANRHYLAFAKQHIAKLRFQHAKQPERLLRKLAKTTSVGAGMAMFAGMVVLMVPVIGILAAIALPLYQNHVNKAEYREALQELSALKIPIETQLQQHGKVQNTQADAAGYVNTSGLKHLSKVELAFDVVGEGHVQGMSQKNRHVQMILLRDNTGLWHCEMRSTRSDSLRQRDVPPACQIMETLE